VVVTVVFLAGIHPELVCKVKHGGLDEYVALLVVQTRRHMRIPPVLSSNDLTVSDPTSKNILFIIYGGCLTTCAFLLGELALAVISNLFLLP